MTHQRLNAIFTVVIEQYKPNEVAVGFWKRRKDRALVNTFLDSARKNAADPRRKVMAEIIVAVLKKAGHPQAPIDTVHKGGYPVFGSKGFWMRVDGIAPGIILCARGYDDIPWWNQQYLHTLCRAFKPILDVSVIDFVQWADTSQRDQLLIGIPSDEQLTALQRLYVRK